MKSFQTLKTLEARCRKGMAWEDFFTVGSATTGKKLFKLYEYGGGSMYHMSHDYVYFLNKLTHDAIYIKYICPSSEWNKSGRIIKNKKQQINDGIHSYEKDGTEFIKKQTAEYRFIEMEYIPNMDLWRIDTL